jgi:hypothetical protein
VPDNATISLGEELIGVVKERWPPPQYYYHLRAGGHVAAARRHLGADCFLVADLKNFFGHATKSRVTRFLNKQLGIGWEKARDYAVRSVVRMPDCPEGTHALPYGFPQSPLLASGCLYQSALGTYLDGLNGQPNTLVSVYMDDVIVSSNDSAALTHIKDDLLTTAESCGFPINEDKLDGPSDEVRIFNLRLGSHSLSVDEPRLSELKHRYAQSTSHDRRSGIYGYVRHVNKAQAESEFPEH